MKSDAPGGDAQAMAATGQTRRIIEQHEERFAEVLSRCVIEKPKLSFWVIIIPIIFVYYMYRIPRYVEGKKRFTEQYLMSRTSALHEAEASILDGREPDSSRLAASADVPSDIQPLMKDLLSTMLRHYSRLLRAEGSDFDSLVRSAYQDRAAFLQVMDRLNEAEQKLHTALSDRLEQAQEGSDSVVRTIGQESARLRRHEAERIFP